MPDQPVPKTFAALVEYENQHGEGSVSSGIWYEVAFSAFLNAYFSSKKLGHKVILFDWGSVEDAHQGKDALVCFAAPERCAVAVDFTTDDRRKTNLVLKIDKRWFTGSKETLVVDPLLPLKGGTVERDIKVIFLNWAKVALASMPRYTYPE